MHAKPALRKSRFVIACLAFHAAITLLFFPSMGHQSVGTPFTTMYVIYFVFTSVPTVFVLPLLTDDTRMGEEFAILLLVNGVIFVRFTANWMHELFVRSTTNVSKPIHEPESSTGRHLDT